MSALVSSHPQGWIKKGYVFVHPDDTFPYPKELFEVDPDHYTPKGPCRDWGLQDPNVMMAEMSMMDFMMAKIAMQKLYMQAKTPFEQYVTILAKRKLSLVHSSEVQTAMKATYRIQVSLDENNADVWRQLIVPANTSLSALSDLIIGPAMGWSKGIRGHVFQDPNDGAVLGPKDHPGYSDMARMRQKHNAYMDERRIPLASILRKAGDYCWYIYDLADHWEHRIDLVEVLPEGAEHNGQVVLVDGRGCCPPEERRGLEGATGCDAYAAFLQRYKRDPVSCIKPCMEAAQAPNYKGKSVTFDPLVCNLTYYRSSMEAALAGASIAIPLDPPRAAEGGVPQCWRCQAQGKPLQLCGKCGTAAYCSRDCQVVDWKEVHKHDCKRLAEERAAIKMTAAQAVTTGGDS